MAHAQTAGVNYWVPGWSMGFSGDGTQGIDSYGSFPSFDGSPARESGFFSRHYSVVSNWSALSTGFGPQSFNGYGTPGALGVEGSQFGYKFKSGVSFYGGFDTLKLDRGSNAFAAFESNSATLPAYRANAGVEFQPAPNVSLSLGFSYSGAQSNRLDSDIRSQALPGETPAAFSSGWR